MKPAHLLLLPASILGLLLAACAASPDAGAAADSQSKALDEAADASEICANLPELTSPLTPSSIGTPFNGSEDFTFDGRGNIVGKRGSSLVPIGAGASAGSAAENIASLPGQTYGLRYHPSGDLLAAIPGQGKVVKISPSGEVSDFATGLGSPNGVFVTGDGTTYVTEYGGNKVDRFSPTGEKTVLVSGSASAQGANGVVVDATKNLLFYTEYSKGKIQRLDLAAASPTPEVVATIPRAALDGLVLDACGNVYAVDNGNARLFRVRVDATGAATAAPELVASFASGVANAQFGVGEGWDPAKLYVTGNPGTVYTLELGVGGQPVTLPAAR